MLNCLTRFSPIDSSLRASFLYIWFGLVIGFQLTLLFVFMTIVFAIIAQIYFGDELTNVDILHGLAESFLTISDAFVVYGFVLMLQSIKTKTEVKNS